MATDFYWWLEAKFRGTLQRNFILILYLIAYASIPIMIGAPSIMTLRWVFNPRALKHYWFFVCCDVNETDVIIHRPSTMFLGAGNWTSRDWNIANNSDRFSPSVLALWPTPPERRSSCRHETQLNPLLGENTVRADCNGNFTGDYFVPHYEIAENSCGWLSWTPYENCTRPWAILFGPPPVGSMKFVALLGVGFMYGVLPFTIPIALFFGSIPFRTSLERGHRFE